MTDVIWITAVAIVVVLLLWAFVKVIGILLDGKDEK